MSPSSSFVLLAAGSNARGQLASGSYEDSHKFHACLFLNDDGTTTSTLPSRVRGIRKLVSGANHALLMLEVGGPVATATAASIAMSASTSPDPAATPAPAHSTSRTRLELWGCGDGTRGQLGAAYQAAQAAFATTSVFRRLAIAVPNAPAPLAAKDIAAAWETSYVVFRAPEGGSDVLVSMGSDDFGALGRNHGSKSGVEGAGEAVVPIESVLPGSAGPSHANRICIRSIAASFRHVFAHVELGDNNNSNNNNVNDAQVYLVSWGAHRHGQRGPKASSTNLTVTPAHGTAALALGKEHTVIVDASGRVSGLGSDRKGQLKGLERVEGATHVGCTWAGTYCVVRRDGITRVFATGDNAKGQLGRGTAGDGAGARGEGGPGHVSFPFSHESKSLMALACGSEHILALFSTRAADGGEEAIDEQREVWAWGWNEHGNLGLGHTEDVLRPTQVWPSPSATTEMKGCGDDARVLNVWAGCGTSWIAIQKQ